MKFLKRKVFAAFCFVLFASIPLKGVLKIAPFPGEDFSAYRDDYIAHLKEFKTQILLTIFCSLQVNFKKNILSKQKEEIFKKINIDKILVAQVDTYKKLVFSLFKDYIDQKSQIDAESFVGKLVNTSANVQTIYLLSSYLIGVDSLLNKLSNGQQFDFKNFTQYIYGLFLILKNPAFSAANFSLFKSSNEIKLNDYERNVFEMVRQGAEYSVAIPIFMVCERMLLDANKKMLAPLVEYFKNYPTLKGCLNSCKENNNKQVLSGDSHVLNWGIGTFQNFLEIKLKEDLLYGLLNNLHYIKFAILNCAHLGFMNFAKNFNFNVIYQWVKHYAVYPCHDVILADEYDMSSAASATN
jgi:hypothetical protein